MSKHKHKHKEDTHHRTVRTRRGGLLHLCIGLLALLVALAGTWYFSRTSAERGCLRDAWRAMRMPGEVPLREALSDWFSRGRGGVDAAPVPHRPAVAMQGGLVLDDEGKPLRERVVLPEDAPLYGGMPRFPEGDLTLLVNRAYCVGYDETWRLPRWAAYRLTRASGSVEWRPKAFQEDARLPQPVISEDYTGSGYDRGHLAPSWGIARCFGREAQIETFLMSNVVPQRHALNDGAWKALEVREARNYAGRFGEIWVLAGPVVQQQAGVMRTGILVPAQFYKILLDAGHGRLRVIAFLFPQECQESFDDVNLDNYLTCVDRIEELTGLDFFPELSEDVQQALESTIPAHAW